MWQWILGGALLLLAPLGWLQYRWIGEVSDSELARRRETLQVALEDVAMEFDRAMMRSMGPAAPRPQGGPPERYAERVAEWQPTELILSLSQTQKEPSETTWVLPAPGGRLVIEINWTYVREKFLPKLLKGRLGDRAFETYAFRVRNGAAPVITLGEAEWEAEAGLLQFGPPGRPRPWRLEAGLRSGTLESAVARGRSRNLALSALTLILLAGSMIGLAMVARRAERLSRLQMEFTAGVTHELKTPLAVICAAGDNLASGLVTDATQVAKYGALVRDEGQRLGRMVEQVLSFAGAYTFAKEPMDVRDVITQEPDVKYDLAEPLPVLGDSVALQHAVRNLVENALKHGKTGVALKGWREGTDVLICVQDEGPGIEARDLPHLFEPYYRGQRSKREQVKGFGLGLALVKRVAEAHGGSVEAKNGLRGASFTMRLPAA